MMEENRNLQTTYKYNASKIFNSLKYTFDKKNGIWHRPFKAIQLNYTTLNIEWCLEWTHKY